MSVKVLFFGATADAVGSRELELNANGSKSTGALLDLLLQKYPKLADHKLLVSVNEEHAVPDAPLNEGDNVAVFTAVSGG